MILDAPAILAPSMAWSWEVKNVHKLVMVIWHDSHQPEIIFCESNWSWITYSKANSSKTKNCDCWTLLRFRNIQRRTKSWRKKAFQ
jgi:hypothetical protein